MKYLVILLFALGLLVFGCVASVPEQSSDSMVKQTDPAPKTNGSMQKPTDTMQKTNNSMTKPADSMQKTNSSVMMDDSSLSGYQPFSLEKYNSAKQQGKYIFLEFYASWCPTCQSQKPHLQSAFTDLSKTNSKIVGFEVNYRDAQTDESEVLLAKDLGISTQHTHIILDQSGKVVFRSNEMLSADQIKSQIMKITG